jgi:hypothetical protein
MWKMFRYLLIASAILLAGCDTTASAIPEHNLVVIYNGSYNEFAVYEDGYRCWHTNNMVEPVLTTSDREYYLLDSQVYCLSWVDTRDPLFHWTLNDEPVSGPIYSAKIIDSPEDLGSYDIR